MAQEPKKSSVAGRLARAAAGAAGRKIAQAVGPKVQGSTSDNYCNRCRKMADDCPCRKPCCSNLRHGFTAGGTHKKGDD